MKLRILLGSVLSVLLNGGSTWKVIHTVILKLQAFIISCLRRLIGVRWFEAITDEELGRLTGHIPVYELISHTLRKGKNSIVGYAMKRNILSEEARRVCGVEE